jgi:peptide/nickel transport system substrate-binding protein
LPNVVAAYMVLVSRSVTPRSERGGAMKTTRALTAVLMVLALAAGGTAAVAQDKPRSGGILTWFDYGDPVRLDIHAESPLVVQQATAGIYSGLLHYDPDDPSKIAGDLAERWTASPDGRTYTSTSGRA